MARVDSYKKRLIVVTLFLAIVGLVVLARLNVVQFENTIISQAQRTLAVSLKFSVDYLLASLEDFEEEIVFLSRTPAVVERIRNESIRAYIEGGEYCPIYHVFNSSKQMLDALFVLNAKAEVLAILPTDENMIGVDISQFEDMKQMMASQKLTVSHHFLDSKGNLSISVSLPVYDGYDLVGYIRGVVRLDKLKSYFKIVDQEIFHDVYALDENGRVLFSPDPLWVNQNILEASKKKYPDFAWGQLVVIVNRMLRGERGEDVFYQPKQEDRGVRRERLLIAFMPLNIGDNKWSVGLVDNYDKIAGPILAHSRNIFLAVEFIILCALGVAFLFYHLRKKRMEWEVREESAAQLKMANQKLAAENRERIKIEEELKLVNQDLQANERALKNMLYDMKNTQDQLKKANEELKMAQSQIIQSEKMAALGQLSAGVAHEIKNPLAIISLSSDSLKARLGSREEKCLKHVQMIKEAADRANKVVVELLNFSRFSSIELHPINLNEVIDASIALVENNARIKNIILTREGGGDLIWVHADKILLQQVFFNLLTNALDAMTSGIIKVRARVSTDPQSTRKAVIEVVDTGEGIPEDKISRIFEPFFTTKEQGKGTGLGLSTAYMIIERHKGAITVESKVGEGTAFTIMLPLADT